MKAKTREVMELIWMLEKHLLLYGMAACPLDDECMVCFSVTGRVVVVA